MAASKSGDGMQSLEAALEIARAYAASDNADPKALPELISAIYQAIERLRTMMGAKRPRRARPRR